MLVVVFEKDLGSAVVVFLIFITMLYVASGKKVYVVFGFILVALGCLGAYALFSHVQVRVETWMDPFADASGTGYQLVQALFSMADGGLFGVGIGRGMCDIIPVVESDFIFAAICEEGGFLAAGGLLLLYLCFAIRGLVTAGRAKSDVSSFIAVGATAIIVLQAFIIVGGVTKLIPLTGLTLPFVSQGGSSLLGGFLCLALLLRCGNEGTGMSSEVGQATTFSNGMGVLGRVSLGKRLTNVMIFISLLFALLIANLTMVMIVDAEEYQNMENNNHTIAKEAQTARGSISTYDGVTLAQSTYNAATGYYDRSYPAGTLASQVVGYYSEQYGASGIESRYNDVLQGKRSYASWQDVINEMAGTTATGNDIRLTLDSTIQQAAQDALDGYDGACVVMDPETGAVLAMASSPTYDANDAENLLATQDDSTAMYNRATQALYIPGSTFKMVTLSTALQDNVANESTTYSSPGSMQIGNSVVTNFDGNNYGTITLAKAMELSSNTVFGQVGVQIGAERLVSSSEAFGFNKDLKFDISLATSLMPDASEMTEWETAWAADGQPVGQHESPSGPQTTVLQMAMVGCAIANDGTIQTPYLVDSIYDSEGKQSYSASPSKYLSPISVSTAQRVKEVLKGVVQNGTGTDAQISGVSIAGKTGTAETGKTLDDSWFVGMGPTDDCKIVVAIVIEQGEEGIASQRFTGVMETALQVQGVL